MDIEVAFLLGVLIGHWIALWALWRGAMKIVKMVNAIEVTTKDQTPPDNKIIIIPSQDNSDLE